MKFNRVICVLVLVCVTCCAYGVSISNPVANADADGFVRFTKLKFSLEDADSLGLFYLEFSTNPTLEPSMFGVFWHMPIFSSKVVLRNSNELEWYAPDGNIYYFCAHLAKKKGKKIESFIDNTSAWRAIANKNGFELVSLKTGATFVYVDNRLVEFMLKNKRRYVINYNRNNGMPLSVKEHTGSSLISFYYLNDQKHIKSIKNCQGIYNFDYSSRRASDTFGSDNFYGNALLLSKIEHPDETKVDEINYSKTLSRPRTLLLKNLTEIATKPLQVRRMSMKTNGEDKGWIEWCASTGIIMADNGGEYMIGNDKFDSFFPNFKPGQGNGKFSAIKYFSKNMPYPEIWMSDFENYYQILGNPTNGDIIRNSKIGACGALKFKTRKTEKLVGDIKSYSDLKNADWKFLLSNSYDNMGRLVRQLDYDGNTKEWIFKGDTLNGSIEEFINGEIWRSEKITTNINKSEQISLISYPDGITVEKIVNEKGISRRLLENNIIKKEDLFDRNDRLIKSKTVDSQKEYIYNDSDGSILRINEYLNDVLVSTKYFKNGELSSITNAKGKSVNFLFEGN